MRTVLSIWYQSLTDILPSEIVSFTMVKRRILLVTAFVISCVILFAFYSHPSVYIPKINFLNIVQPIPQFHNYYRTNLFVQDEIISIFVHGEGDHISREIINKGSWEIQWLLQLIEYVQYNPKAVVIDLGCNVGVYTLVAARWGHRVIAIDANRNNTDRLMQSLITNKLDKRVTVLLNAISNKRKVYTLSYERNNVGGQSLIENGDMNYKVKSIVMDDLVHLFRDNEDVIIKMDIQGSEIDSLKAASKLFAKVNIKVILMEWILVKKDSECLFLIGFLLLRNYKPYNDFFSKDELLISAYKDWPYDIVWRKLD